MDTIQVAIALIKVKRISQEQLEMPRPGPTQEHKAPTLWSLLFAKTPRQARALSAPTTSS